MTQPLVGKQILIVEDISLASGFVVFLIGSDNGTGG